MTSKFKDNLQNDEFIKEVPSLNSQLMQHNEVLCQKISKISPYCETNDKLTNHFVDMRLEYDEIHKRISDFSTWKELEDGRKADLEKLEESHKDILFTDWDFWLKQAERETTIAVRTTNNIIEAINKIIHGTNMVMKGIPRFLLSIK